MHAFEYIKIEEKKVNRDADSLLGLPFRAKITIETALGRVGLCKESPL